jgi:PEP-CTERM motif
MTHRFRTSWILMLLSLPLLPGTALAVPMSFDVYALANSTSGTGVGLDTGLGFTAGDVFTVTVALDDLWNAGALPRWSNADGLTVDLFATGSDDSGEAAGTHIGTPFPNHLQNGLSLPFGSLVGSIDGTFFLLGTSFSGPAPATGNLLLYYWDSNNSDNTEFVTAYVDPDPRSVPEPSTLFLLSAGAMLFGLRRLRRRPAQR